jgi:hypothetical protein
VWVNAVTKADVRNVEPHEAAELPYQLHPVTAQYPTPSRAVLRRKLLGT